ncbi:MAG: branched-chain amino acid ABC transporter substrate-binding protein [Actinobacteria bacterium]|nr:MAG: branched-chain amino acid ABC transporter substrate-binding protein [Actinomycetota bacterium]
MRALLVCGAVAVLTATAAGARPLTTPGVTSTEIKIGSSVPLSGEAAIAGNVARGIDAYFDYINAKGGIFGRKIKFTYLDDGYDPGRAVNNTIRLVQQEQVFAMFSSLGTSNNLAVRKLLNDAKVPQLFVSSGATTFGRDYKKYPWTIGYIPPYSEEGAIYGQYVVKKVKKPKIAVLYQDDDYGRDLFAGLKRGLGPKAKAIVAKVGYDPTSTDVTPEVTQLRASKANVFMIFAFGKFSLEAFNAVSRLGWKPQIFVNDVSSASALMAIVPQSAANGSISIVFGKDPAAPLWKRDKGIRLFQSILKQYGSGIGSRDLQDGYYTAGMATAYTLVDTLKKAGRNLTREGVMRAATHLSEKGNPFVLPGIVIHTTSTFRYPLSQVRLQRWSNRAWHPFGKLIATKPG